MSQMIAFGIEPVKFEVKKWLTKCAEMLDIALSPSKLDTLSLDILDKYKTDSLEDVRECLKKGRQGYYSDSRDSVTYGKLNMEVISKWMGHHLEEKSAAREQQVREERERSEEEHSGSRLIDIIENQKAKVRQMVADGKPDHEIEPEYKKVLELEGKLKESTRELHESMNAISKAKNKKIEEVQSIKVERLKNKEQVELEQAKSFVKDYSDQQLKFMLSEEKDSLTRSLIEQELKNRVYVSTRNPKEGREAVKG